jgi:hypothetical protein
MVAKAEATTVPARIRPTNVTDAPTPTALAEQPEAKASAWQLPVTLTRCLEHDHGTFRLKDTAGAHAPKSHGRKSVLKKNAVSIEVIDRASRVQLRTHVG